VSNFLAIATVTATLKQLVRDAVAVVPGADVTTNRPDGSTDGTPAAAVNVFLYRVGPNGALRNDDVPTRDADGRLTRRPQAALNLDYLLTFRGNEGELEPQRLLGTTVAALESRPVLTRDAIADVIAAAPNVGPSDARSHLGESNLDRQPELVRFAPLPLALDDLSKLWSVFFQTPYSLSVAYEASVVLIEGAQSPRTPLPVRDRTVTVVPLAQPALETVEPQLVEAGGEVTLVGRNLLAEETTVRIGALEVAPDSGSTANRLVVTLPLDLRAGVNTVRVAHGVTLGTPPPRPLVESNVAAFVLRPRITGLTFLTGGGDRRIRVQTEPIVGVRQQAFLLLTELASPPPAPPRAFTIDARPRADEADPLLFDAAELPAATYLARVRIDGAESAPTVGGDGRYDGPTVTLT
jgi:Pvc16 N-terminal domain